MPYLTSELITDAYYLSSIVSREFETPTGSQMSDGLNLLNDVIADRTLDRGTIPFTSKLAITAVPGQSEYFLLGCIDVNIFVFYINSIRYQTVNQQRNEFFGSYRATNIASLPFEWHFERSLNGGNLSLYFTPNVAYPMEVWGTFSLNSVTEFQDLELTIDKPYRNFLKYLLVQRLCQFNSFSVPADVSRQLSNYYQWIDKNKNVMDLRQRKYSSLGGSYGINWGMVNLSGGWVPNR